MQLYALKPSISFQLELAHLSSSWLLNQATSFSQHIVVEGAYIWQKMTTDLKASWDVSH